MYVVFISVYILVESRNANTIFVLLFLQGWTYKAEASFLEIYNETIRDLLATPKEAKNLSYDIKLVDNKKNESYVTNLKVKFLY